MNLMDLFIKVGVKDEASGPLKKLTGAVGGGLKVAAAAGVAAVGAAATAVGKLVTESVKAYGEYEQLVGGAKKIFDQMDYSVIANDAANAWSSMNLSASEYLSMMNNVGATFAATMGDEKGYETAKRGMQAIADYASGTGKNVGELNDKFALITRSSQSYQSIADQFSGILPATSKDFLEQAQAAGYLSDSYKQLTEVPIAEYQEAVSLMLEKGVDDLNLTGNTAAETANTITGSLAGLKATWANLITGIANPNGDLKKLFGNLKKSVKDFIKNVKPIVKQALSSIGELVAELGPELAQELPGLMNDLLPDLISSALELVKGLGQALPGMFRMLVDNIPSLLDVGKQLFTDFADGFSNNIDGIVGALNSLVDKIVGWFANPDNLDALLTGGLKIVVALAEGILAFAVNIITNLDELVTQIANWFAKPENLAKLRDAGGEIVNALWEGMKALWPTIARWAGSVGGDLFSIGGLIGGAAGGSGYGGGGRGGHFAIGSDYVPYNNYPAMLHRGEAVLTAREADAWRRGEGSGRQIVNNFSFNGVSQSDLDYIVGYVNRELVSG